MAEAATIAGSVIEDIAGPAFRDGKIFASNSGICVEQRYPVAYNLGAGECQWPGWISVGLGDSADIKADLLDLSVIPSESADAVAAIHVLEHLYEWDAFRALTEWKRILKPGGTLILELPCMDKVFMYIGRCVEANEPILTFMSSHVFWGDPKHHDPLMCHRWGYFIGPLKQLLEQVGFSHIERQEARYHHPCRDMRWECVK